MNTTALRHTTSSGVFVLLTLPGLAFAQAAVDANTTQSGAPQPGSGSTASDPDDASAQAETGAIGDIVVTARRREESIQSVPIAVTAIAGSDLARLNVTRADDLVRVAPGLVIQPSVYGSSNLAPTIRSQRQALTNGAYDASVGIYFAEVPQARTYGLNAGFFDVSSVQVLKGPQGTLFGRNTTGGAVIITPNAPTDEFGGYFLGTLGNYALKDAEGAINLPVTDAFQLRFSGKITRRDGYTENRSTGFALDDDRSQSWRASARLALTDTLSNTLVVNGFHEKDQGIGYRFVQFTPGSAITARLSNIADQFTYLAGDFHRSTNLTPRDGTKVDTFGISNITELDIGAVQLKNVFGFRRVRSNLTYNSTGGGADPITEAGTYIISSFERGKQLSEEINLSGKAFDDNLDFIVGAFYFRERNQSYQYTGNRVSTPTLVEAAAIADPTNISYAAYAQATLKMPFYEPLSLTAGVRYNEDERRMVYRSRNITAGTCRLVSGTPPVPLSPCIRSVEAKFSEPTYNLSLDWKPSSDLLIYAATRHGYRSGGFTFTANTAAEAQPYRPETVDDIEVGFKSDVKVLGTPLRVNAAFYHQKYKNIQRNVNDYSQVVLRTLILNAAAATIDGAEIEATWLPVPSLELSGSFSHSNPRYDSFIVPGIGGTLQDFTRSRFAGAPKNTVTGLVRYSLPVPDSVGPVHVQFSGYYQSSTVAQDATSFNTVTGTTRRSSILDARTVFDVRLNWQATPDINLAIYSKNVFDEEYYSVLGDFTFFQTLGSSYGLPGAPRTIGVQASVKF